MVLSTNELSGGLALDRESFFPTRPENPDMRESTSIWLFEETGAFGFPRIGIEGEAWSWDNRLYHANFNMGGGRILHDTGRGPAPSPIDAKGTASIFGAGPLTFRCIEPFRRWGVVFDGTAVDGTLSQQIGKTLDPNKRTPMGGYNLQQSGARYTWDGRGLPRSGSSAGVASSKLARATQIVNSGLDSPIEDVGF